MTLVTNAVDDAVQDVFVRAFGCALTPADGAPPPSDLLAIAMPLVCDGVEGSAVLGLPRGLVALVAGRLLAGATEQSLDEADLRDFGGEICNMLVGRIATRFSAAGTVLSLGTPQPALPADAALPAQWLCAGLPLSFHLRLPGVR
ncbi:MAG: chemotaxis protein CheX [Proteobacteria bacterium]|nr:chemotaxis protein CheX [Pseudomonadota bacterium]